MPIPKHNEIRIPVLEFLKKNASAGSKEMAGPLSEFFGLSPEEVNQMYEFGIRSRHANRAGNYHKKAG
jgi:restriction system protein